MHMNEFGISNFKAFGNPVSIPIKPITLIFGANSSGKSSFLQSLLLLKQSIEDGNGHGLFPSGSLIDLRNYKDLVYAHDTHNNFTFNFSFDTKLLEFLSRDGSSYGVEGKISENSKTLLHVLKNFDKVIFSVTCCFDQNYKGGINIESIKLYVDTIKEPIMCCTGDNIGKISQPKTKTVQIKEKSNFYKINEFLEEYYNHDVGNLLKNFSSICNDFVSEDNISSHVMKDEIFNEIDKVIPELLESDDTFNIDHNFWKLYWEAFDKESSNERIVEAIPNWLEEDDTCEYLEFLDIYILGWIIRTKSGLEQAVLLYKIIYLWESRHILNELCGFIPEDLGYIPLQKCVLGTSPNSGSVDSDWVSSNPFLLFLLLGQHIQANLHNTSYLGPLRKFPSRHYVYKSRKHSNVGKDGLNMPEILYSDRGLLADVNTELEKLGFNYQLNISEYINQDTGDKNIFSLNLSNKKTGHLASWVDVGFGFSQILPIITQCVMLQKGGNVQNYKQLIIEQPELHLHPAMQAELGDLFLSTAVQDRRKDIIGGAPQRRKEDKLYGKERLLADINFVFDQSPFSTYNINTLIIETHSEHLILRILRRIRETTDGELPEGFLPIRPDDVALLYVEPCENGSEMIHIPITENGEFARPWPQGFFPERAKELF